MTGFEIGRRAFVAGLASSAVAARAASKASTAFVFAYFRDDEQVDQASGLHLAVSHDGTRFEAVRGGASVLAPQVGDEKILRDPCLFRGPAPGSPYHLVWTTGWRGTTLGHATSHDLVSWSTQQAVPVMQAFPGTLNVWAPEGIWHPGLRAFVLFWSSTVPGMFSEALGTSKGGLNNRIFYTVTRDFRSFAPTKVLFDPGFTVIDATFLTGGDGRLHLVVKDERLHPLKKNIRNASAASPTGPFGALSDPVTEHWTEGPTAIWLGDRYRLYFDAYRAKRYGAIDSSDLEHWTPVTDLVMPVGARHGTVLPISPALASRLRGHSW
jgi:hypothetical protein